MRSTTIRVTDNNIVEEFIEDCVTQKEVNNYINGFDDFSFIVVQNQAHYEQCIQDFFIRYQYANVPVIMAHLESLERNFYNGSVDFDEEIVLFCVSPYEEIDLFVVVLETDVGDGCGWWNRPKLLSMLRVI